MYTALADVYDIFYEDDSAARADYYASFLPEGGEGLDVGCGTGALTVALSRKGLRISGMDSSPDMLSKACDRALREGARVRFVQGDASGFTVPHKLDFVVAALDVYNYVPKLSRAFTSAYEALREGGTFAFDISSEYKLKHVLAGNTFSETKQDVTYIWQNFLSGKKLTIDFTVFSPCGASYIKTCETQVQYVRSEKEITDALEAAGFKSVSAYAFGTRRKPRVSSERILFAAVK